MSNNQLPPGMRRHPSREPLTPAEQRELLDRARRIELLLYKLAHGLGLTFEHETGEGGRNANQQKRTPE